MQGGSLKRTGQVANQGEIPGDEAVEDICCPAFKGQSALNNI